MKKKLIVLAVVVAVIVGLLAYYQYVPFWASIVSTGAFIAGILLGWNAKGWSDEHVTGMKDDGGRMNELFNITGGIVTTILLPLFGVFMFYDSKKRKAAAEARKAEADNITSYAAEWKRLLQKGTQGSGT